MYQAKCSRHRTIQSKNGENQMRKCTNKNCEKRNSCLNSISRLSPSRVFKVKKVFCNNESTCEEYVKVGKWKH